MDTAFQERHDPRGDGPSGPVLAFVYRVIDPCFVEK